MVGAEVLSSPSTSRTPVRIPPGALSGLGFQFLPDRVGFSLEYFSGVFLPHLKLVFSRWGFRLVMLVTVIKFAF